MAGSSASSSNWSYDVFLNFRGIDTRNTITAHLYNALDAAVIHTFMDDVELRTGEEIGPELLSSIEQSRISIPIFSDNYASSKWCLDELVKIDDCRKTMNQLVLPIFYHVHPSDVRNHTGTYGEAFQKHNKRFPQKTIDGWKEALSEVGALKGWDLENIANGNEGTLIKLVVGTVSSELEKNSLIVSNDLVGIQSPVEKMINLLNIKLEDVKIVGVWGLGGIGKTTIAKVVYNEISHHFEGCSFLENVRDASLIDLQNQLVSEILKGVRLNITNVDRGINVIKGRLCRKKVLIILDDVDESFQLNALAGKCDWFGLGSRIIITTRNQHILVNHRVDEIYEPSLMDEYQSLQLFSKHAFKRDQIPEDYLDLAIDIVKNTGGLPLALEVIGSSLFGMSKSAWQDTLKMLEKDFLHDKVQKSLMISFDGLTPLQKEIFLDIACFFNGMDKNIACFIWQQCNFYPEIGIEVLCQKSLVKIGENNKLKMHDLLRDLGKEIIRQGNKMLGMLKPPGKRSRLWSHKEALDVLEKHTGTDKVEGLRIDFGCSSRSQQYLMSKGFTNMTKLRLLQVDYAHFAPDFVPSFSELTWLRWKGCPAKFTLTKFNPVNLVVLDLSDSVVTANWMGWNHIKVAKNLKVLNLMGCKDLVRTPELTNLRLEVLILENCLNLVQIDESINYLQRLVIWNMRGCSRLRSLPYGIWGLTSLKNLNLHQCERLDKLPDSIGHLKNLENFDASFCYIKDGGIPDAIGWLSSLEILKLGGNNFHSLPVKLCSLSSLQTFDLRFCNKLESLPELPSSLKCFNVLGCTSLKSLPSLSNLTNLEVLCLDDCDTLVKIPALLGSRNLKVLNLDTCESLAEIEGLEGLDSLELLVMINCRSLWKIGKISGLRNLKELRLEDHPMLSEIEGLEGLNSLELLTVKRCKSFTRMPKLCDMKKLRVLEMEDCKKLLKVEALMGLDSLERLSMKNCESLRNIGKISGLRKLKEFRLEDYPMLVEIAGLQELDSLELLTIKRCKSFRRMPKLCDMKKLRVLEMEDCKKLFKIEALVGLDSLERLFMKNCESLSKMGEISGLRKLKELRLTDHPMLSEIEGLEELDSLELLIIEVCASLRKIGKISGLRKLKELILINHPILSNKYFVELVEIEGLVGLDSLELLRIKTCRSLREIPGLSDLEKLRTLEIMECSDLKEIQALDRLESLETLDIRKCRSMNRLPDLSNLRNLKHLSTFYCVELKEIQGLHRLESLETLDLTGCRSLERLPDLSNLRNLECLSTFECIKLKEIQGLNRMESLCWLDIRNCLSMTRLPDLSNLRNLKNLFTGMGHEPT